MEIRDQLTFLSENMQDVILLIEDNDITYITESYKRLFNNKLHKIENIKDLYEIISIEDKDILDNYNWEIEFEAMFRVNTSENEQWIWIKSSPIVENGIIYKSIVTLRDITDKVIRENLKSKSRMDSMSNIIHEFKTPLNLIFSSIQLVRKQVATKENYSIDYLKKYLDIINQNSYRILKLVNNICDDTKKDLGHHPYNPTNQDIIYFIESICQSVTCFANLSNMDIIFDTDIEELIVSFDIEKMEKIILNLLSNGVKFRREDDGKILVTVSHDDKYIHIKVRDNGIGIEKEKLSNIFGKYVRLNDERSLVKEGTGIGLSLVHDFVQAHSGTIDVDSCVGEWTEFSIKIPNIKSDNEHLEIEVDKPDRIEKIKVEFSDIYI